MPWTRRWLEPYRVTNLGGRYEVTAPNVDWFPPLRMRVHSDHADFHPADETINHVIYPSEEERGDPFRGKLWCPGAFVISFAGLGQRDASSPRRNHGRLLISCGPMRRPTQSICGASDYWTRSSKMN